MKSPKAALVIALAILLAALVFIFFRSGAREVILKASDAGPAAATAPAKGTSPPTDAKHTKKVTLFFVRPSDGLLAPEEREIAISDSLIQEAEEFVTELIKGPAGELAPVLPVETRLGRIYITRDGTAYVDFSREVAEKHPSGTTAELSTIYAVVDGLAYNFKSIKKVFLLVDGEERETLAGHVGLDRAFLPDYSRIAKN
jgi:spore germination protein GerM